MSSFTVCLQLNGDSFYSYFSPYNEPSEESLYLIPKSTFLVGFPEFRKTYN